MTEQPEYLTTREVADLLRMRERRVYDLAAAGEIPCRRVTGRLLFPRAEIDAWIGAPAPAAARPAHPDMVVAGSHDPLLDWALRASGCALPSFLDGSLDGLDRLVAGTAAVAGCHVPEADGGWNLGAVEARLSGRPVVVVEWARRETGLLLAPGLGAEISGPADLAGRRVAQRQESAGAQILLQRLLAEAGVAPGDLRDGGPSARTEAEAAGAVAAGTAEAAPGLACMAREYRLDFVPLATDRFDLVVDRWAWFEPPWQRFLGFCAGPELAARAAALGGYDISGRGRVHWNGG